MTLQLDRRPCSTAMKESLNMLTSRKIRIFRNGDDFHKGCVFAINSKRYPSFQFFLDEINSCGLLLGTVRYIFTIDGKRQITQMSEFEHEQKYVCSVTPHFIPVEYNVNSLPEWQPVMAKIGEGIVHKPRIVSLSPARKVDNGVGLSMPGHMKKIVVVRLGVARPRAMIMMVLSRMHNLSMEHFLSLVVKALDIETGIVRKLYSMDKLLMRGLDDIFESRCKIFFASGTTAACLNSDFEISKLEGNYISRIIHEGSMQKGRNSPQNQKTTTSDSEVSSQNSENHDPKLKSRTSNPDVLMQGDMTVEPEVTAPACDVSPLISTPHFQSDAINPESKSIIINGERKEIPRARIDKFSLLLSAEPNVCEPRWR